MKHVWCQSRSNITSTAYCITSNLPDLYVLICADSVQLRDKNSYYANQKYHIRLKEKTERNYKVKNVKNQVK